MEAVSVSKTVANEKGKIEEQMFTESCIEVWSNSKELYELLKTKASGEERQVVLGVGKDNGWEAWRRLAQHFEPNNAVRRGQVLSELGSLNHKRCKNPQETLVVLVEI